MTLFDRYDPGRWLDGILARHLNAGPSSVGRPRLGNGVRWGAVLVVTAAVGASVPATSVAFVRSEVSSTQEFFERLLLDRTPTTNKQRLLDALEKIGELDHIPLGDQTRVKVSVESVKAAAHIVRELPNRFHAGKLGVDEDGNVYVRLEDEGVVAFLTVEPHSLHLLCMRPDADNTYIDNVPFGGKRLPGRIRQALKTA